MTARSSRRPRSAPSRPSTRTWSLAAAAISALPALGSSFSSWRTSRPDLPLGVDHANSQNSFLLTRNPSQPFSNANLSLGDQLGGLFVHTGMFTVGNADTDTQFWQGNESLLVARLGKHLAS